MLFSCPPPARHDLVVDWAVKLQHKQTKCPPPKGREDIVFGADPVGVGVGVGVDVGVTLSCLHDIS